MVLTIAHTFARYILKRATTSVVFAATDLLAETRFGGIAKTDAQSDSRSVSAKAQGGGLYPIFHHETDLTARECLSYQL